MSHLLNELQEFHRFLSEKLRGLSTDMSPEQALDEWRRVHPDDASFEEDVAAIQEALDDVAKGERGIPFEQFDREFRARYQIPDRP